MADGSVSQRTVSHEIQTCKPYFPTENQIPGEAKVCKQNTLHFRKKTHVFLRCFCSSNDFVAGQFKNFVVGLLPRCYVRFDAFCILTEKSAGANLVAC